jgi:hypothetical protein
MFGANPIQYNTLLSTTQYFQAWWWMHHVIVKDWGVFQDLKKKRTGVKPSKILEGNLVQSAFHQILGH